MKDEGSGVEGGFDGEAALLEAGHCFERLNTRIRRANLRSLFRHGERETNRQHTASGWRAYPSRGDLTASPPRWRTCV